jgi:hypothetical protein
MSMANRLFVALAALCGMLAACPASAKDRYLFPGFGLIGKYSNKFELRLGVAAYDTGIFTTHSFNGTVINGELLFPSPDFLSAIGSPRPMIGVDIATASHAIHFAYLGLNWDAHFTDRLYATWSLGGAITSANDLEHSTRYKNLGCKVLFHLGAGLGYDLSEHVSVELYADHFSNADLCTPNNGAESAGIRFAYRF